MCVYIYNVFILVDIFSLFAHTLCRCNMLGRFSNIYMKNSFSWTIGCFISHKLIVYFNCIWQYLLRKYTKKISTCRECIQIFQINIYGIAKKWKQMQYCKMKTNQQYFLELCWIFTTWSQLSLRLRSKLYKNTFIILHTIFYLPTYRTQEVTQFFPEHTFKVKNREVNWPAKWAPWHLLGYEVVLGIFYYSKNKKGHWSRQLWERWSKFWRCLSNTSDKYLWKSGSYCRCHMESSLALI